MTKIKKFGKSFINSTILKLVTKVNGASTNAQKTEFTLSLLVVVMSVLR